MAIDKEIYRRVLEVKTKEQLLEFLDKEIENEELTKDNIDHAIAAFMLAASNVLVQKHGNLIDKDKAGDIMWNFIRHWLPEFAYAPIRMLIYEDLLFPQFERNFKTITKDIQEWVKKQAEHNLKTHGDKAAPELVEHWRKIINGYIPYDLELEEVWDRKHPPKPRAKSKVQKIKGK